MSVSGQLIDPSWQRRLTADEYHRMIDAAVFDEDEHLELLEGVIVAMSPQGARHALVIERLNRLLLRSLGDEVRVRPQLPLTLSNDSEPEPDLAVVATGSADDAPHPRTALLVIEVATESLARDRGPKALLYARADVPEYWIVNLVDGCIEVLRDPDVASGPYRTQTTHTDATITATSVAVTIAIRDLLR